MHHLHRDHYPFTAIVGQERLTLALLLNAINPRIGGVLIRGEKGTVKSTAARGLSEVLPEIDVVAGCPYHCHPTDIRQMCDDCVAAHDRGEELPVQRRPVPFVTLPLGATEDRVVGTIDVGRALSTATVELHPGLLAEANRGVLYVDEVNLLDDHLVDLLLDAAAMGRNIVEREGLSVVHPARFVLVGTMNPEEGELRPQLLDRFGMAVDVQGIREVDQRVEILRRLTSYERDPHAFAHEWDAAQLALGDRIERAMTTLPTLEPTEELYLAAAQRALDAGVDGHRADLTMVKAALTIAAWEEAEVVSDEHLDEAAELVLPHRLRRRPFEPPAQAPPPRPRESAERSDDPQAGEQAPPPPKEAPKETPIVLEAALPEAKACGARRGGSAASTGNAGRGHKVGSRARHDDDEPIEVAGSLLAAAVRQGPSRGGAAPIVEPSDLRTSKISARAGRAVVFLVDASGSMEAKRRLEAARIAARSLLEQSYQGRHQVALVVAAGAAARVALPFSRDTERLDATVAELVPGGKTPLASGLALAGAELDRARGRGLSPTLVVITDGRANAPREPGGDPVADALEAATGLAERELDALVVDTENDFVNLGLARELAETLGADLLEWRDAGEGLGESIVDWVKGR